MILTAGKTCLPREKITIFPGCLYVGMYVGEYTCISSKELLKLTVLCTKDNRVLFTYASITFHLLSLSLSLLEESTQLWL